MGTNLKDLIITKEVDFDYFRGKKLVVDTFNILYQFLSTIRQRDGGLLKDSEGNVTSHLAGIFSRTTRLMKYGINLAFVFDGKPPELKQKERERRIGLKKEAMCLYEEAKEKGDIEKMKKYASRTSHLTKEMIEESKELISALGLPVIQAASEGEAQMAYVVEKKGFFAGVSEDYDSLLYGIPNLVKNLTVSGKRKVKSTYINIKPKIINFAENMNALGIDKQRLILLAMLVGTDYNPGGVKGIGPKTALKLVKDIGNDPEKLFKKVEWDKNCGVSWEEILDLFQNMSINPDFETKWKKIDFEKIKDILIEKHDFSEERVVSSMNELLEQENKPKQKGLGDWI